MELENRDIRWKQRFQNFSRAFILLRSELDMRRVDEFSQLEKEGLIQRFEFSFELAWKTLKDYLEYSGIHLDEATPRKTIKEAASVGVLEKANVNPELMMEMLAARNALSHTYDFEKFIFVLNEIQSKYLSALDNLHLFFMEKRSEPF